MKLILLISFLLAVQYCNSQTCDRWDGERWRWDWNWNRWSDRDWNWNRWPARDWNWNRWNNRDWNRWSDGNYWDRWSDRDWNRWYDGDRWRDGSRDRWYDGSWGRWYDGSWDRWYDSDWARWWDKWRWEKRWDDKDWDRWIDRTVDYQGRDYYYPGRDQWDSWRSEWNRWPYSCRDIFERYPKTPSGWYYIYSGRDNFRRVYCEMEKEFCGLRGWERFFYLDFSRNNSHLCPESFRKGSDSINGRDWYYCEGTVDKGCTTSRFLLDGARYNEVCAKIGGYQHGLSTAFRPYGNDDYNGFMDGIYFSYGKDERYLWSYVVGSNRNYIKNGLNKLRNMCPDVHHSYDVQWIPRFVGDYWYCDSGTYNYSSNSQTTYYDHRLWEGWDCSRSDYNCKSSGQPWFYRWTPTYFTDYIEMHSCRADWQYGDVWMDNIEIYLR